MSLPLWVRENTLLPWGQSDTEVEYDYADGVELRAYHITKPVEIEIPDRAGKTAAKFRVQITDGQLEIVGDTNWPCTVKAMGE